MSSNRPYISAAWLVLLIAIPCVADQITVDNHAPDTIYASVYYVETNMWGSTGPAQRITPQMTIPSNKSRSIERPAHKFGLNRELIFSVNKEELQPILDVENWKARTKVRVDTLRGSKFHIALKNDTLKGYDNLVWLVKNIGHNLSDELTQLKEHYSHHPYASITASLQMSNELAPEEVEYQQMRAPIVKEALEEALNTTITQSKMPCIAACLSGGGMRAAIGSYALCEALRQLKLINALTYIACLSGSTWFTSTWLMSGMSLESYKDYLYDSLTKSQLFNPRLLAGRLWPKYLFGQHSSIVDLYGVYLANTFYDYIRPDDARQELTITQLQARTRDGLWPFPLFTCGETTDAFHWCTFTPYQFSCDTLDYSIPIWAFGRQFKEGRSVDVAPEFSLGFLMGIWGSALSGSLHELLELESQSLDGLLYEALQTIIADTGLGDLRLAAIKINNPLYHIQYAPFEKNKQLIFIDGWYGCNLPLVTLMHAQRNAQIIFVLDVSEGVHNNAPEFQKGIKELRNLGYVIPPIDFERAVKDPISIFSNPHDPWSPTFIFVAPIKNDRYDANFDPEKEMRIRYNTARFIYNEKDIDKFVGLILFNIIDNQKLIYDAIKEKMETLKNAPHHAILPPKHTPLPFFKRTLFYDTTTNVY